MSLSYCFGVSIVNCEQLSVVYVISILRKSPHKTVTKAAVWHIPIKRIFGDSLRINQRCSIKKGVLRNFTKFVRNTLPTSAPEGPSTLFKKILWPSVFLWILRKFWKHLFYGTLPGDCFPLITLFTWLIYLQITDNKQLALTRAQEQFCKAKIISQIKLNSQISYLN